MIEGFMKSAFRFLGIAALAGCTLLPVSSCSDDYDDSEIKDRLDKVEDRVTQLEEWCSVVNSEIVSLKGLITALENNDYVTGVETLEDGYKITFSKSGSIIIRNGKDGADGEDGKDGLDGYTPVIGVAKHSDGLYYWTIQAEDGKTVWLTDAEGNMIRTTGDNGKDGNNAPTPIIKTGANLGSGYIADAVYISVDGGENWTKISGDKGNQEIQGPQGDAIFAKNGIDYTSDPDNVIFTLADGKTKITLPRTRTLTVGFDSYETFMLTPTSQKITIVLPKTLKEEDYTALVAEVKNEGGIGMDIVTRATVSPWQVTLTKPTFVDGVYQNDAEVTVTAIGASNGDKAILKIMLIDKNGQEISALRVLEYSNLIVVNVPQKGDLQMALRDIVSTDIKALKITGTLGDDDFKYIRENLSALETLDLSENEITELPIRALAFYDSMGLSTNNTLTEVILPEGLTTIGNSAFAMCENLQKVNIPRSVRTLGRWMFEECKALRKVEIPEGVIEIPASAFYHGVGITSIIIPSSVATIGNYAFSGCTNLESITIPSSVSTLGGDVFYECVNLQSATILANVEVLPVNFFMEASKLQNVTLSPSIKTLESNSFSATGLTAFTIPPHITVIKAGAFSYCKDLHTVTLPAGLAQLEWSIFYECTQLSSVTIPEGIKELGAEMFRGCIALESIDLPSTITSIRDRAFQDCSALRSFVCRATTSPALSAHDEGENYNLHFYGINSSCVLKVPAGTDYSTWSSKFKGGITYF